MELNAYDSPQCVYDCLCSNNSLTCWQTSGKLKLLNALKDIKYSRHTKLVD